MIGLLFLLLQQQQGSPALRDTLPTPPPCGMPFHDAAVLQRVNPELPQGAALFQPVQGAVQVTIAPDGTVTAVQVVKSTGDSRLDAAIVEAAKKTTYQPKTDNCTPTVGTYMFSASFGTGSPPPSGAPIDPCNHEGRIITPARPIYPISLQLKSAETALVRVTVGADGSLTDAEILQSTGNETLDRSAIDAAKHSAYAPKVLSCKPIVAQYVMKIVFNPH